MAWIQLKLRVTALQAEAVSEACLAHGALAVTFQDAYDRPILEPLPGEFRLWGENEVIALYDAGTDMVDVLATLRAMIPPEVVSTATLAPLADRDWIRESMAQFVPLKFGKRLWISPSWRPILQPDAVNVILDPGLAFGTGSHPTTALCLEWLAAQPLVGKRIIDFGCGSGILAIAALKLGAASAIGIDSDPQALQASRDNAQRNGVSNWLTLYLADEQPADLSAEVVLANILAEPLRRLATLIGGLVSPGGHLVLSGILVAQADAVAAAYSHQFTFEPPCQREEWCCISGVVR